MESMDSGKTASMPGTMEAGKTMGDWKIVRILGKGNYGTVGLLQNGTTKAQIALKVGSTSFSGSYEAKRLRNNAEVQRMYEKVDHPHIVNTQPVPEAVRAYFLGRTTIRPTIPLLAMEYCCGGDLRQLLRRPENVNGLSEKDVRLVLSHISEAISYLHKNRMVHRDIKPENIVIQHRRTDEPAVYKLGDLGSALDSFKEEVLDGFQEVPTASEAVSEIACKLGDLGLAKDLPPTGSTCSTLLGTRPYLAPEIGQQKKYNKLVDYWSFGLVAFEIICGRHPFFGEPPEVWLPWIQRHRVPTGRRVTIIGLREIPKDPKIIPEAISKFPRPTRLSHVLRQSLEAWLPSMLEINPTLRGKFDEKVDALQRLRDVIRSPILYIRYFNRSLSYDVSPETTVTSIKAKITEDLKIPQTEQVILTPCGLLLCDSDLVLKQSKTVSLYLLRRNECLSTNFDIPTSLVTFHTGDESNKRRSATENQKLFADAIRFLQTEIERVETLAGCCEAMRLHHRKAYVGVVTEFEDAWKILLAVIEIEKGKLQLETGYLINKTASSISVEAIQADADKIHQSFIATRRKCQEEIQFKDFPVQNLVLWYEKVLQMYQEFRDKRAPGSSMESIPFLHVAIRKFAQIRTSIVKDANAITHFIGERIRTDKNLIIQLQTSFKELNDLKRSLTTEGLAGYKGILELAYARYPQHVPAPQPEVVKEEMQRAANVGSMRHYENKKTGNKSEAVFETDLTSRHPQPVDNTDASVSMRDDVFRADSMSTYHTPPENFSVPSSSDDIFKANVTSPHPQQTNNTGYSPTHWDILDKCARAQEAQTEVLKAVLAHCRNQSTPN